MRAGSSGRRLQTRIRADQRRIARGERPVYHATSTSTLDGAADVGRSARRRRPWSRAPMEDFVSHIVCVYCARCAHYRGGGHADAARRGGGPCRTAWLAPQGGSGGAWRRSSAAEPSRLRVRMRRAEGPGGDRRGESRRVVKLRDLERRRGAEDVEMRAEGPNAHLALRGDPAPLSWTSTGGRRREPTPPRSRRAVHGSRSAARGRVTVATARRRGR